MTASNDANEGRYLFTQYADDLRQEVNGKVTIVGVYQSQMIFPQFPAQIPRLGVLMTLSTPVDKPFQRLIFALSKDGERLLNVEIDQEVLAKAARDAENDSSPGPRTLEFQFGSVIGPLLIEESCILQGRVETELGELLGRPLRVIESANHQAHE